MPFCASSAILVLGLFTTEILRDFCGEGDALKSQEGEGHPLSLLSLKRACFGLLRIEGVLPMTWLLFMLNMSCYASVFTWFWYSMHA